MKASVMPRVLYIQGKLQSRILAPGTFYTSQMMFKDSYTKQDLEEKSRDMTIQDFGPIHCLVNTLP